MAGFNSNRFDIPVLVEEFMRAGVLLDLSKRKFVDVQNIYHKLERRTLIAAYKYYCGKDLENAHSALADTRATYEVLQAQLDKLEATKKANEAASYKAKPIKETITYDDFQKLDIRVGTVLECERVPKMKKLLKFRIDDGLEQRTIISGISQFYEPEQLIGKQDTYHVQLWLDICSVEMFVEGGKANMTNLVFPKTPYNKVSGEGISNVKVSNIAL